MRLGLTLFCGIVLTACAQPESARNPQDPFFTALRALCGKAYQGTVVSSDSADAGFAQERLVMHVRDCDTDTLRIPFHVGENRSRTWVVTRNATGLRLKHDHRHEDGSADAVTLYGGDTVDGGSATRQLFPADESSKELFERNGLSASIANVWAIEIHPGETFAYELRRPDRFFRAEFALQEPVATPPAAWGAARVPDEGPDADAVRRARERFNDAIAARDVAAIAALHMPTYHIVTGRSDQSHGQEDAREVWASMFESDPAVIYRRVPREVRVNGRWGLAEELGDWNGSYTAAGGPAHASGVYAAKWQRDAGGTWLLQSEVFTTLECKGPEGACLPPAPTP